MMKMAQPLLHQLTHTAEAAYPAECCGFLLGTLSGEITSLLPAENRSESAEQYHRFQITPEQMLAAERTARERGLEIVGFYHSHPDHPAVPSEFDRSHALPVYRYPIVSVMQGRAAEVRCWVLDADTGYHDFTEETLQITEKGDDHHVD